MYFMCVSFFPGVFLCNDYWMIPLLDLSTPPAQALPVTCKNAGRAIVTARASAFEKLVTRTNRTLLVSVLRLEPRETVTVACP